MNKKLLLLAYFVTATLFAAAQFEKGSILLGGDVGFGKSETKDAGNNSSTSNNFNFSPTIGFATKKNTFHGVVLNYGTSKSEINPTNSNSSSSIGGGYFYRKYKPLFEKFYGFLQAGANVSIGKQETKGFVDSETKSVNVSLSLSPGLAFAITKKVFIETGFSNIAYIYYQNGKRTVANNPSQDSESNSFGVSSSLSAAGNGLYFGFRIMLPK
jgi:hypothetical protein